MMEERTLCLDEGGVLRGECTNCKSCNCFSLNGRDMIRFKSEKNTEEGTNQEQKDPTLMSFEQKRQVFQTHCEGCNCPSHLHKNLDGWLASTRQWIQKFQDSDDTWPAGCPPCSQLPVDAKDWDPIATALRVVTNKQFDPMTDGRQPDVEGTESCGNLVSVVCTSLEKNHFAHPLLYECFCKQTYEPRELVVVDTGTRPSAYLQECARKDHRVTYRFYFCEEHGLEQAEDPLEYVKNEDNFDEVMTYVAWTPDYAEENDTGRAEVWSSGLTLGLKRNIAIYLAHGSVIMHFNAGDLYSADYVSCMHSKLSSVASSQGSSSEAIEPAAVRLGDWHALNLPKESFRQLNLSKYGHHLPAEMRKSIQCARGFTYVYTRTVWLSMPFPNAEWPEGHFPKVLERAKIPFELVHGTVSNVHGLAAHSYDKENSSGADCGASMNLAIEIKDLEDCSGTCPAPRSFGVLMPVVKAMVDARDREKSNKIEAFLQIEGSTFFCTACDAALAMRRYLKQEQRLPDGGGGKCEVIKFSRAGGVVGEGDAVYEEPRSTPQRPFDRRPVPSPMPQATWGRDFMANAPVNRRPPAYSPQVHNFGGSQMQGRSPAAHPGYWPKPHTQAPRYNPLPLPHAGLYNPMPRVGPQAMPNPRTPSRPEPDDSVWFPGWSRRNAICRCCGKEVGWRYEVQNERNRELFWVLEKKNLRERRPAVEPSAQMTPQKLAAPYYSGRGEIRGAASASSSSQENKPKNEARVPVEAHPPAAPAAEGGPAARKGPADEPKTEAQATKTSNTNVRGEANLPSAPVSKEEKALQNCRKVVQCFSPELQTALACGVSASSKGSFDGTLNNLKIDSATSKRITKELLIRPGIDAAQQEKMIAKCFKGKVNSLRSIGVQTLRAVLQESGAIQTSAAPPGAENDKESNPKVEADELSAKAQAMPEAKKDAVSGLVSPGVSPRGGA